MAPVAGEGAEPLPLALQHGAALDVELDERVRHRDRVGPRITDRRQGLVDRDPGAVAPLQGPGQLGLAGEHAAAEEARLEAGALLVGPVGDDEVAGRPQPALREGRTHGTDRLAGRDDAEGTVEAAAIGLAVEVGADHDRRRVAPGEIDAAELVADPVDLRREPVPPEPAAEPVAGGAVLGREREARHRPVAAATEARYGVHHPVEASGIDPHEGRRRCLRHGAHPRSGVGRRRRSRSPRARW